MFTFLVFLFITRYRLKGLVETISNRGLGRCYPNEKLTRITFLPDYSHWLRTVRGIIL